MGKSVVSLGFPRLGHTGRLVGKEQAASQGREGSGPEKMGSTEGWWENGERRGVNVGVGWCSHTHMQMCTCTAFKACACM